MLADVEGWAGSALHRRKSDPPAFIPDESLLKPHSLLFPDQQHTVLHRSFLPLLACRPLAWRQPKGGVPLFLFLRIAPGTITFHTIQLKIRDYCTAAGTA